MRIIRASVFVVRKVPVTLLRPRFWMTWSLLIRSFFGLYGLNQSCDLYVMTGMTHVLNKSLRLFWLRPVMVLPRQVNPDMTFLAFAHKMSVWCLNESLRSR